MQYTPVWLRQQKQENVKITLLPTKYCLTFIIRFLWKQAKVSMKMLPKGTHFCSVLEFKSLFLYHAYCSVFLEDLLYTWNYVLSHAVFKYPLVPFIPKFYILYIELE